MSYTVKIAVEKLKLLLDSYVIMEASVGEEIQNVIDLLEDPKMLLIEWGEDDVQMKARERKAWLLDVEEDEVEEKPLTDIQVAQVINLLERTHDCTIGMTWDTIDCALDNLGLPEVNTNREEP